MYVDSDDRRDGPQAAITSLGLNVGDTYRYPLTGTPTETNARLFLNSIDVEEQAAVSNGKKRFTLAVVFSPIDPNKDPGGPMGEDGYRDPFAAPPTLRAYGDPEEEAVMHDKDGTPILNTAGDPYDPGLSRPKSLLIFEIGRVEREFDYSRITDIKDHLNDAAWMGFPARSVMCLDIQPERVWSSDANGWTWPTVYKFAYREDLTVDDGGDDVVLYPGWTAKVLNQGLRQKVSGERKQIFIDNAPVSAPVLLKDDGTVAAPTDDPVYKYYDYLPEADFSVLDFPSDLFSAGTPEIP
ncbi:hypothetical protein [Paludisphaera rhizosphaerae]|uniref:hypothetical protein n=1 Tax=Paludisphaera rhizosphaerae TaxID=2711216 RepID=UPI0013E9C01F|nr:hypothetical protein [Paludisphaera rhizosphaerae]